MTIQEWRSCVRFFIPQEPRAFFKNVQGHRFPYQKKMADVLPEMSHSEDNGERALCCPQISLRCVSLIR